MLKHILGLVEEGGNAVIEEEDDDDIPLVKNYCMLYTKYFPRCTERLNDYKLLLFFAYCEIPNIFAGSDSFITCHCPPRIVIVRMPSFTLALQQSTKGSL